jgi:hypothetical protein
LTSQADFWSTRKAKVKAEEAAEAKLLSDKADAEIEEQHAEKTDQELLDEHNLPDPSDLKAGDDVSGFMAKTIPERLRQRALRKLWTLNPILANVDGLVDYGEDFTDAATVIENLASTYQVGKGMLAHIQYEEERAKKLLEETERTNDEAADDTEAPLETAQQDTDGSAFEPDQTAQSDPEDQPSYERLFSEDDPADDLSIAKGQRMRFQFHNESIQSQIKTSERALT